MSQSASESTSGNVIFGTDESTRPINWPLLVGVVVVGLLVLVWFKRK